MTKRKFVMGLLTTLMLSASIVVPQAASAAPSSGSLVTGINQAIPGVGTFTGNLTTTGFSVVNGVLNATGTLKGTFVYPSGVSSVVNQVVNVPVTGTTGTCTILTLNTGTIHLNLLGLDINLAPINLVITAQSGPGNLLGNLLCDVVNLLNAGGPLSSLASLLNSILAGIAV